GRQEWEEEESGEGRGGDGEDGDARPLQIPVEGDVVSSVARGAEEEEEERRRGREEEEEREKRASMGSLGTDHPAWSVPISATPFDVLACLASAVHRPPIHTSILASRPRTWAGVISTLVDPSSHGLSLLVAIPLMALHSEGTSQRSRAKTPRHKDRLVGYH